MRVWGLPGMANSDMVPSKADSVSGKVIQFVDRNKRRCVRVQYPLQAGFSKKKVTLALFCIHSAFPAIAGCGRAAHASMGKTRW